MKPIKKTLEKLTKKEVIALVGPVVEAAKRLHVAEGPVAYNAADWELLIATGDFLERLTKTKA